MSAYSKIQQIMKESFFERYKRDHGVNISQADIVPLFYMDFWDGPISGLILCLGEHYYIALDDFNVNSWSVFPPTKDEKDFMIFKNEIFKQYVGDYTNYYFDNTSNTWVSGQDHKPAHLNEIYYGLNLPRLKTEDIFNRGSLGFIGSPFISF